jgi:hypothetical protein
MKKQQQKLNIKNEEYKKGRERERARKKEKEKIGFIGQRTKKKTMIE